MGCAPQSPCDPVGIPRYDHIDHVVGLDGGSVGGGADLALCQRHGAEDGGETAGGEAAAQKASFKKDGAGSTVRDRGRQTDDARSSPRMYPRIVEGG